MLQFIFRVLLILSFAIGQITDFNLTIDSRNIINNQNLYITTYLCKLVNKFIIHLRRIPLG